MRRWWRSHSVRVRLTLWYVAAMILVLGVYAAVIVFFVSRNASQSLEGQLRRDFQLAAATIYRGADGALTWDEPEQIVPEQEPLWVQVWSIDGRSLLFHSSEAERLPVPESQALAMQVPVQAVAVRSDPNPIRILSRRSGFRVGSERFVIQVGRSEGPMREEMRELILILVFGLPLAVAVAGLGGYTLARRALLPVERMTERAQSITAERLADRLPVDNPDDEMGRLATVFNETLGRLQASFDQMRRFTADVSHELRTPLTSIRSVGEVGLREHRNAAEYRGIIGSMLEEADRLASLVDRLLTLSRAESGQAKLSIAEVDVRALANEVASHLGVLAEEKRQAIVVEGEGSPRAAADRLVLRQALISLVDNAIKFSPAGGRIRIRVAGDANAAIVDVIDSGRGIEAADRARIFDRFYRAADGTAQESGSGLGLSIAKWGVEANGGRLTLEQSDAAGSTFRITVPGLAPAARRRAAG
jgi:heavy metal sensor kinase